MKMGLGLSLSSQSGSGKEKIPLTASPIIAQSNTDPQGSATVSSSATSDVTGFAIVSSEWMHSVDGDVQSNTLQFTKTAGAAYTLRLRQVVSADDYDNRTVYSNVLSVDALSITAVIPPAMSAMFDGFTIGDNVTNFEDFDDLGNYASNGGTISSAVLAYLGDAVDETTVMALDETAGFTVTVSDSAANELVFTASAVTVLEVPPSVDAGILFLSQATGALSDAYDFSAHFTGSNLTYALDVVPAGATFNTSTGILSAYIPGADVTLDIEITATNSVGSSLKFGVITSESAAGIVDTFSSGTSLDSYVGESGLGWVDMGTRNPHVISGGKLFTDSHNNAPHRYDTTAIGDQSIAADFEFVANYTDTSDFNGTAIKMANSDDCVMVRYDFANSEWRLQSVLGGTVTLQDSWSDAGFKVAAQTRAIVLSCTGTAYSVTIDGTERMTATIAGTHLTGVGGVRGKGNDGTAIGVSLDNIAWPTPGGGGDEVISTSLDMNAALREITEPEEFYLALNLAIDDLSSYATSAVGGYILSADLAWTINGTPDSDPYVASSEDDTVEVTITVQSSTGATQDFTTNLATVQAVAAPAAGGAHSQTGLLGGNLTDPITPLGFSIGRHYLPDNDGSTMTIEPGRLHKKVYVGRDSADSYTWSRQDIATAEAVSLGTIDDNWLRDQEPYVYGASETHALDEDAGKGLWKRLIPVFTGGETDNRCSHWLLLERGGAYTDKSFAAIKGARGESALHPILVRDWGSGDAPQIPRDGITSSGGVTGNWVTMNVEMPEGYSRNTKTTNLVLHNVTHREKELTFDSGDMYYLTLSRVKLLDAHKTAPVKATLWAGSDPGKSRISAMHPDNHYGILVLNSMADMGGWENGYSPLGLWNDGEFGQAPYNQSHNFYFSGRGVGVTFREMMSFRAASSGSQWRMGGHMLWNVFAKNGIAFQLGNDNQGSLTWCNISNLINVLIQGAGYKVMDPSLGSFSGAQASGIVGGPDPEPVLSGVIVSHADDPIYPLGYSGQQPTSVSTIVNERASFANYYVDNWMNRPDENLGATLEAARNAALIRLWADQHQGVATGTHDIISAIEYIRTIDDLTGIARSIYEFCAPAYGIALNTHPVGAVTCTFAPWDRSDGFRWDNPKNWSGGYMPEDGDNVTTAGLVTSYDTIAMATFNIGSAADWYHYSGKRSATNFNGAGTFRLFDCAQLWPDAVDSGAKTILMDGGRFATEGTVAGDIDYTVAGEAEWFAGEGGAITIGAGNTLDIVGSDPFVGFDGQSGTSTITMNATATLQFTELNGEIGVIAEFTSGKYGAVETAVASVFNAAGTLTVDCTGLAPSAVIDLVTADTINGDFGTYDITGGSAAKVGNVIRLTVDA
jgi:hypothetical protein